MDTSVPAVVSLAEWRRAATELYGSIRADNDHARAWKRWCDMRRDMFSSHPQSPIPAAERATYGGPFVYPYDPRGRILADLDPLEGDVVDVGTSDGHATRMIRFARAHFELFGRIAALDLFWLDQYGGGIYLAFRDATSGDGTYGGGRYLLDTVKGADLGVDGERLVLDFNFAYQPSCSYDPSWSCPLPPAENTLSFAVPVGERLH